MSRRSLRMFVCGLAALLPASCTEPTRLDGAPVARPVVSDAAMTRVPIVYGSERPLVELVFARADGRERRVLAWVNMGAPTVILSKNLYRELGIGAGRDLAFRIGEIGITVAAAAVTDGPGELDGRDLFDLLFAPRQVEAVLPASVLRRFAIVLDPAARTLTLAPPGTLKPAGVPVPIRVDPASGIATVEARVGDTVLPLVLDAGAPYTWLRGSAVAGLLRLHPAWHRADGAVGRSNLAMADLGLERDGTLVRLPDLALGDLVLPALGALGTGPMLGRVGDTLVGELFWDLWQKPAPIPLAGWLGGNVLSDFRLTIDYAAGLSTWQRQRPADPHDLDGIGLTLVRQGDAYAVSRVAERNEQHLVAGVEPGDRLVAVDGRPLSGAAPELAWEVLRGHPGTVRRLDLERDGRRLQVEAPVVPF
ncbi:peptide-binding protein [Methylobacterium sp. J-048]|uniref:peptide-binding protein n=1 Tax=Methylobacterium sp. J-048 TaxID=2836635 RepID=UPI001FB8AE6B|nr:peptide-binding protein [Methylobacterium sp. J-048]MCJ2060816.1 peptide-binding protein [Methylobacterium sp. J-048]